MAASQRKVTYLAEFQCLTKGLAAGKAHVLCQESTVYLSNGSEFVYVYNKEEKLLKAIYGFPGKIWNIELVSQHGQLYALCAENGIYCVSVDGHGRSMKQADADMTGESCPPTVCTVGSEDCILLDPTICTFTVVTGVLVTVSKLPGRWRIQKFQNVNRRQADAKYRPASEMEIPSFSKPGTAGKTEGLSFLPVLCCVAPHTAEALNEELPSHRGVTVEASLYSLLFGVDAALLHSPMILCGFPDGYLSCIPLKAVNVHGMQSGCPKVKGPSSSPQMILYHLEQPVVFIGALRHQHGPTDNGLQEQTSAGMSCDCIVALGHQGKFVTITSGVKEETTVLVFKEHHLGGPVVCGFSCDSSFYYSTRCNIFAIHKSPECEKKESLPIMLPVNLNICSAVAMTLSSRTPEGDVELLALSAKGRLMMCSLSRSADKPQHARMTTAKEGQKIKELLSRIGSVSERASWLKHAIEQKNRSLSHLNQVLNLSCALLSSHNARPPVSCTVTAVWRRLLLQDSLMVSCCLENLTDYSLERGWTLCVHLSASPFNSNADSLSSATVYSFPINKPLPGNQMEVTFPLHGERNGCLDLPVTVSCTLFYSFTGILGKDLVSPHSQDPHRSPSVDLLEGDGVCLPLKEHVIDVLQCLRLHGGREQGITSSTHQSFSSASDAVETFLRASMKQSELESRSENGNHQGAPGMVGSAYGSLLVASVRLSSDLLGKALKEYYSGSPLCCTVLQWALSDNAWVDTVKAQKLSGVHGIAPDGRDVRLLVSEVTVNDLCPEGPIPAVEIKMESSSLAVVSSMHQAVLRRVENLLTCDAPSGYNPPGLQMKYLQQMITNNEVLLKEAQSLRDRLCRGKESSTAAERLLNIYRELRNPSLVIL